MRVRLPSLTAEEALLSLIARFILDLQPLTVVAIIVQLGTRFLDIDGVLHDEDLLGYVD